MVTKPPLLIGHLGNIQPRQLAQLARRLQRLYGLTILDGPRLLNIQRLLIIGQLALEAIHFAFGLTLAQLQLLLLLGKLLNHGQLLLKTHGQIIHIFAVLANLAPQGHSINHLGQLLRHRFKLIGQMFFPGLHLLGLFGQIDGPLLLFAQQPVLILQLPASGDGRVGKTRLFRAITHEIRRHIMSGFGDEIAEQIPLGLGFGNGIQSAAILVDGRLHVLECLTHPGIFRQQVLTQRTADG